MIKLSIIIPVYNEEQVLGDQIHLYTEILASKNAAELIFVDGGSIDETTKLLNRAFNSDPKVKILNSHKGRASQMNFGAEQASGDCLLFLHVDTQLPEGFKGEIDCALKQGRYWGRFDVTLNAKGTIYRIISWFMNRRSRLTGIATGDQSIFVSKDYFEKLGGYPDQLLMEDVELSKRLKQISMPYCSAKKCITSARKWQTNGPIKTIWLMWSLRYRYYRGADPKELFHRYYR